MRPKKHTNYKVMEKIIRLTASKKYEFNPFIEGGVLKIDKGKKTIIAGGTKDVMMNTETGEVTGMALLHRVKEIDKTQFIKIYIDEVKSLFDLSKTGIRTFNYILTCMRMNEAQIYLNIHKLVEYAEWTNTTQAYKGLGELIANSIIAPSCQPNIWFINPNVIFNGDRIAFIREFRMKEKKINTKDPLLPLFNSDEIPTKNSPPMMNQFIYNDKKRSGSHVEPG